MKEVKRGHTPVYFSLPFLCLVYFMVVASSFLLAERVFAGVFAATIFTSPHGILPFIAAPFALLAFLGLFLYAVIADSLHSGLSGRFSSRIFLATALLLFSVAAPTTLIVSRYAGVAVGSWYDRSVSDSLAAVEDIGDLYVEERLASMERVADRYFTGLAITSYRTRPSDWMSDIRALDPHAVACQVYRAARVGDSTAYQSVIETGDSARFLSRDSLASVRDGLFTVPGERDVFRFGAVVRYSGSAYACVYTADIPAGFTERMERVRATRSQAKIVDTLKPFLPLMGIWVFAMFILPSLLIALVIAYRASCVVADPVRAILWHSSRLAEGDFSWRSVPRSRDETAEIAMKLNAVSANRSPEKADKKGPDRV